jgi:hypothetical protein
MYPYTNEDVAFERLKDLQREMENSRLMAGSPTGLGSLVRNLAARVWWLGGLAMQRSPRPRRAQVRQAREESAASDGA